MWSGGREGCFAEIHKGAKLRGQASKEQVGKQIIFPEWSAGRGKMGQCSLPSFHPVLSRIMRATLRGICAQKKLGGLAGCGEGRFQESFVEA